MAQPFRRLATALGAKVSMLDTRSAVWARYQGILQWLGSDRCPEAALTPDCMQHLVLWLADSSGPSRLRGFDKELNVHSCGLQVVALKACSLCVICGSGSCVRPRGLSSSVVAVQEQWLLGVGESYGAEMQTDPYLAQ